MGKPSSGGTNVLKGTRGNDTLTVTQRVNEAWTVDGGAGNDVITGGNRADTLLGGGGNDTIFGSPDDVRLDGGSGYDTLDLSSATGPVRYLGSYGGQLTYWPDSTPETYTIASGFEHVIGGAYSDYLSGGAYADTLNGAGGVDYLSGGPGDDTLIGGAGADYFEFSHQDSGNDRVADFEVGQDHLFFYGVAQPNQSAIYVQGDNLVVPWSGGTVTLIGLGELDPAAYASLFTLTNGSISVVG